MLDAREFKTCLLHALRTLFGASGAAMEVDSASSCLGLTSLLTGTRHTSRWRERGRCGLCLDKVQSFLNAEIPFFSRDVAFSEAEKVRSALTLVGEVDGQPCRFEVCQVRMIQF